MPNKLKFRLNDLPPRYRKQIQGKLGLGDSPSHANMEPVAGNAPVGKKKGQRLPSPCRIHVTHFRHRLADYDNLSIKACLDQIVRAGILADDSAIEIEEISHRQVKTPKTEAEGTVIEITPSEAF